MMDGTSSGNNDLISPIPQRAYAFVGLFDGEDQLVRPQSVPWGGAAALVRPVSAPVGVANGGGGDAIASGMGVLERPSSPLSRVTNPMVRDHLFRKGFVGGEKVRKGGKIGVSAPVTSPGGVE